MAADRATSIFLISVLFSVAFCVAYSWDDEDSSDDGRIIGGQITNVARVPYIVQLRNKKDGAQWCSGTLVAPRYVVTAAHCLDFCRPKRDLVVVGGVSTLSEAGVQRSIVDFHKPKAYNRATFTMDFAVLKLASPMNGTNIKYIPLRGKPLQPGDKIQVSGWGRTSSYGNKSQRLKTIILPIISNQQCQKTFDLTPTMICAAAPFKGPCQYDSGGPAVTDGKLVGIVSWGNENCVYNTGAPAVYTKISRVLPFIRKVLKRFIATN